MTDMHSRPTKWPTEVTCCIDGCQEIAWIVQDQGNGYVDYECSVHGAFAIQYDDPDDDFEDNDFSDEYDPWEDGNEALIDYEFLGDEEWDDGDL